MLRLSLLTITLCAATLAAPLAQTKPAAPATPRPAGPPATLQTPTPDRPPAEAAPREPLGQSINVKLDITITDMTGPGEPLRKTVSMVVADRFAGSIRTAGTQVMTANGPQPLTINVDATPTLLKDGAIRLVFGLEYQPRPGGDNTPQGASTPTRMSQINERMAVIVQDGKPLVISQAADAGSDRKVTVELKATVLK